VLSLVALLADKGINVLTTVPSAKGRRCSQWRFAFHALLLGVGEEVHRGKYTILTPAPDTPGGYPVLKIADFMIIVC
jgi:hypothetical protein